MSPTSYQAAPPRTFTIAKARGSVKFYRSTQLFPCFCSWRPICRSHQVLYGEPSLPIWSDPECTSSIPVDV